MKTRESLRLRGGNPRQRRYSIEELLEVGREVSARFGARFTLPRFTRESGIGSSMIERRFGSWAEFRLALGLPATRGEEVGLDSRGEGRRMPDEWLFAKVRELCRTLGPNHTLMDFSQHSGVSHTTIIKRFNGWLEFRRRAGLPPRDRRNWKLEVYSQEELIDRLREIAGEVGPSLTVKEFARRVGLSIGTVYKHFGSWSQARDYANLSPHVRRPKKYSDDFLLSDVDHVARGLGRAPTMLEYKAAGNAHPGTLRERFGSGWDNVIDRARRWCEYRRAFPEKIAGDAYPERPADTPRQRPADAVAARPESTP